MSAKKRQIAFIGECMIELAPQEDRNYRLGFAGDTLNAAIYCARVRNKDTVTVDYVTALGDDHYSADMLAEWLSEGIQAGLVRQISNKLPGLYLISNNEVGERAFYYYRSQAAARDMFEGEAGDELCHQLFQFDILYLSSITLAILKTNGQKKLLDCLSAARKKGITVAFDTNFRLRLWPDQASARGIIEKALQCASIALPSYEDAATLFGDHSPADTVVRLKKAGVDEVIVKNGEHGYWLFEGSGPVCVEVPKAACVVDTTGAGDAFNGTYMGERLNGKDPEAAARRAAEVACQVVGHRGAILSRVSH